MEERQELILKALGYDDPKELNCADHTTAIGEIFTNDFDDNLDSFLDHLVDGLAKFAMIAESPLTKKVYRGFSIKEGEWCHKLEA